MDRLKLRSAVITFFLICLVTGGFSFQYYNQLQRAIREESQGYLQEISQRIETNISRIIETNYSALYSIADAMDDMRISTFETLSSPIENQKKHWNFQEILLLDRTGKAYRPSGQEVVLNNYDYVDMIVGGAQGFSTTQMVDSKECVMFVVPMNLLLDGRQIVALATVYDMAAFEQTLSMTAFGGQAYSCVVSSTGTMVMRPPIADQMKLGYNVLSTIESGNDDIGYIRTDIQAGRAGQAELSQNGERYYMVYTPVRQESWYLLTFVPTQVVNEKSDMLLETTVILCGVITMIFAGLTLVLIYTFHRNKQRLEQIAYVDEVTGGNTIQKFYEIMHAALEIADHPCYALVYTNIQKFKVLNEQLGRVACDNMLKTFYEHISTILTDRECVGRISADNFCVLLRYESESLLLERFRNWFQDATLFVNREDPGWSIPLTEFGIYIIEDETVPIPQMIDRAKLALREFPCAINSKFHYAIYNKETHRKLFREKQLEDMMESALQNHEFQVFLQPKYRVRDQRIGGAEALARWSSESEGMIYPSEFIPLFEKNGFIVQLDLWMFEQVCICLRRWIDLGLEPVKISVNCSRVQLNNRGFLSSYVEILNRYGVPPALIEIELTESIVMEDAQRLSKVIDDIHAIGFGCSMDDFGNGYSSLNMIQSIPVDTLKLDRIFFDKPEESSRRTESVIESIVGMANALSMQTVAEGIEYKEQVEMLERVGCDYIQGYVFARPMPVEEFERLAFGL